MQTTANFQPTNDGTRADFNVIDWATGVQIYSAPNYRRGGLWFIVARPATPKHSGNVGIEGFDTLAEAEAFAATVTPKYAAAMAGRHAAALRMNRAR